MSKLKNLKTAIAKEIAIILVILAILGGGWYFTSMQEKDSIRETRVSKNKNRGIKIQIDNIEKNNSIVKSSIMIYVEQKNKLDNNELSVNNKEAQRILDILRRKHRINNLILNISPEEEYQDNNLTRDNYKVTFSDIDIRFDAISDLHTFSFIKSIEDAFPGYIHSTYLNVNRELKYNNELLYSIANGDRPRVVSTNLRFLWLGIPKPDISENNSSANLTSFSEGNR